MSDPIFIERRSAGARLVRRWWSRWDEAPPALVRGAECVSGAVLRLVLQKRIARRAVAPRKPFLVSVGNLALGGTGKTPVVISLAEGLGGAGLSVAVLTRGYGSSLRGPLLVEVENRHAGDEARLMARRCPACAVIQSRRRVAGLALAASLQPAPDVVLIEDGHQTAGVARHLDILILDRWRLEHGVLSPQAGLTVPWGHYREDRRGAERAAIWLVESEDTTLSEAAPSGHTVVSFSRRLTLSAGIHDAAHRPWGLISGIGRPEIFEAALAAQLGTAAAVVARFDDHHRYTAADVREVVVVGRKAGLECWLTTEKDAVKLISLWPAESDLLPVPLSLVWTGDKTLPDLVRERLEDE